MHQGRPMTVCEWFMKNHANDFPGLRPMEQEDLQEDSWWNRLLGRRKTVVEVSIRRLASQQGYSHKAEKYPYQVVQVVNLDLDQERLELELIERLSGSSTLVRKLTLEDFLGDTLLVPGQQSVKVYLASAKS